MPRPILVPLDGSTFAERGIQPALAMARRNGLRVELVLVHEPFIPPPSGRTARPFVDPSLDGEWRSRHGAYMRDLVARLQKSTSVPVSGFVMDGAITAGIVEHAAASDAQLVVMATHADTPGSRLWLGSVPRAIAHASPVPVVLVKAGEEAPEERYHKVLVPLDGSHASESAVRHAVLVAGKAGVEYTLLRVVTPVEEWEIGMGSWSSEDDLAISEAREYLESHAQTLREEGFTVSTEAIRARRSGDAIIRFAKDNGIDLISVTTHSRSAASRFFRRSVADRIAREPSIASVIAGYSAPVPDSGQIVRSRKRANALI
jgi:nucleotide-binding universal stress UspA family protein